MLRRILSDWSYDRYGAKEVASYFLCVASVAIAIAVLLLFGGDGDGGTGPKPSTPPPTIPDRPPAEWFSEFTKTK